MISQVTGVRGLGANRRGGFGGKNIGYARCQIMKDRNS